MAACSAPKGPVNEVIGKEKIQAPVDTADLKNYKIHGFAQATYPVGKNGGQVMVKATTLSADANHYFVDSVEVVLLNKAADYTYKADINEHQFNYGTGMNIQTYALATIIESDKNNNNQGLIDVIIDGTGKIDTLSAAAFKFKSEQNKSK